MELSETTKALLMDAAAFALAAVIDPASIQPAHAERLALALAKEAGQGEQMALCLERFRSTAFALPTLPGGTAPARSIPLPGAQEQTGRRAA